MKAHTLHFFLEVLKMNYRCEWRISEKLGLAVEGRQRGQG